MKKIFLVDPALESMHGHHYTVTEAFSTKATEAGFEVFWLVHQNILKQSLPISSNYQVHACFSKGTYDAYNVKKTNQIKKTAEVESNTSPKLKQDIKVEIVKYLKAFMPEKVYLKALPYYYKLRNQSKVETIKSPSPTPSPITVKERNLNYVELRSSEELKNALEKFNATSEDLVFFHTCDAETYRDLVELFSKDIPLTKWKDVPRIHCSTPYDDVIMPHNKRIEPFFHSINRLRALGVLNKKIFLHAENELLSKHLNQFLEEKVTPIYIPFKNIDIARSKTGPAHFSYIGAARTEKGFPGVAKAVFQFIEEYPNDVVNFSIQITPQIVGYSPDVKDAVDLLRSVNDKRLTLIDGVLNSEEYNEIFMESDAIFLCYVQENYRFRSSGIVMEALLRGKSGITTSGTYPSFVIGDAGENIRNHKEITGVIKKIADSIDIYRSKALTRKKEFFSTARTNSFLQLISQEGCNFDPITFDPVATGTRSPSKKLTRKQLIKI